MLRAVLLAASLGLFISCDKAQSAQQKKEAKPISEKPVEQKVESIALDTIDYDARIKLMVNGDSSGKWPAKAPYPKAGAILPYKRIIAFYGNLYSTRMGILGELPKYQMFAKLKEEVRKWEKADPKTPVQPALHYIAVTAQGAPGPGNTYRMRMPFKQIDTVVNWAKEINGLVFIDVQVGLSTIQKELPEFEQYLKLPNVHFGMDPEFSMKSGDKPGAVIGTYDAADINYVVDYLTNIVKKYNLPPKVLVVHRFTQKMVTNYQNIKKTPEVQIVMHMDGWGEPAKKLGTYKYFIQSEPVQFTGFKLFYKNDLKREPNRMLTPDELMKVKPRPLYIQYQ